jgi:hypothetical protein
MTDEIETKREKLHVAEASFGMGSHSPFGETLGSFFMPNGADVNATLGLTPEKLFVPKEYHAVLRLCYDFYQRGGVVGTVMNRLSEFTITDLRNGQRETSDEANQYFQSVLHDSPSRLMRFLRTAALEYFLSGMVLPKVEWEEIPGEDIHPDLKTNKVYEMPVFDLFPPQLVEITWAGWGKKKYWLKLPEKDVRMVKNQGGRIKEQQLKYQAWVENYPSFVTLIQSGADKIDLLKVEPTLDPILRKELSISQYPTPYLFPVLEPLIFKQQLRRMDFAVAARVINAVLLVQEGDKDFPLTEDNKDNLDKLKEQILARSGNPLQMERLFILFSNHTTKMTWITPDVSAMLDQDKYRQVNEELEQGLGFTGILLTGESRQAQASEVSTWAIQPQMEEFRSMLIEWVSDLYIEAAKRNKFRKFPVPQFKPIKLQDFVKTAAVFAALFAEGNVSRTTRTDMAGIDFETEAELMKDEEEIAAGLPAYTPTPYSPPPPMIGQGKPGRPQGSQNVPVNNRNSGVKPKGQKPLSSVKASTFPRQADRFKAIELMEDEELIGLINRIAEDRGLIITPDDVIDKD